MSRPAEQYETSASSNARHQPRSDDGFAEEVLRPRKKQRKQRPCYSCEIPCSNCVRRDRAELCNAATAGATPSRQPSASDPGQAQHPVQPRQVDENAQRSPRTLQDQQHLRHVQQFGQPPSHGIVPVEGPQSHTDHHGLQDDHREQLDLLSRMPRTQINREPASASSPALSFNQVTNITSNHGNNILQGVNDEPAGSYGTLMIGQDGRSKYLGPTAGSEWLKDSETQDPLGSPVITRAPTPDLAQDANAAPANRSGSENASIAFPFNSSMARISTRDLLLQLPPREEAWTLAESYFRYCAWHHDVAPKSRFEHTFNRVYALVEKHPAAPRVDPQEIALVFVILAQGTIFNIEMPYYDSSAEEWLHLAERALVKGEFLSNNTVAGLQTLHLMAHLHLILDKGRRGDNAWPLWGLVMRLAQAMGMHRDGTRWNLTQDVVEERRKVFWEVNAADTFQAHCFSRPCTINPEHCDTEFPTQPLDLSGEKSYTILRYELSQLSAEILNMAMKVRKPPYADVIDLNLRLYDFERNLPFSLRSRAAFLAMPSRFPQANDAIDASPEPSRRSMIKSFQQMNLALNISETIINLHRPYYAKALYDDVGDRINSMYATSFLTVIERCAIIINIVTDIHVRFPAVSNRQWNLWFHVFGCALCLGTLLLRDPGNTMSSYVLTQIDAAVDLFTSLIQHGAGTPRYRRNLEWLIKLRGRASSKVAAASATQDPNSQARATPDRRDSSEEDGGDNEDVELLGWRTRLIERAGQARQTIRTIRHPTTPLGSHTTGNLNSPQTQADLAERQGQLRTIQGMSSNIPPSFTNPDVTDSLLHDFWDPLLLQDIFGNDQPMQHLNNGFAWWEDNAPSTDISQMRFQ